MRLCKETQELAQIVRQDKMGKLVGGNVICPLHVKEEYGGFFFYAQHLVQIMSTIFGDDVKEVFAHTHGDTYAIIAKYDTFDVTVTYGQFNYYMATVIGAEYAGNRICNVVQDDFKHEMEEMQRLLRGGKQAFTCAEFIKSVYVMEAIQRTKQTGKWAKV